MKTTPRWWPWVCAAVMLAGHNVRIHEQGREKADIAGAERHAGRTRRRKAFDTPGGAI
jgi:hypothetical protein